MTEIIKEFTEETYKPLQYGLTIKKSKVHGLGLFATADIEAGWDFGETHVFVVSKNRREWVRTPLGGFINHSEKPNVKKHLRGNKYIITTIRDIEPMEELFLKYTFYKVV